MTTTNEPELHWVPLEIDASQDVARLIFGQVLVADIGADDALWIEPANGSWVLSHNTRALGRHASAEAAKSAAEEYFSTM